MGVLLPDTGDGSAVSVPTVPFQSGSTEGTVPLCRDTENTHAASGTDRGMKNTILPKARWKW